MILTVTVNAALDVTYAVEALTPHTTHRVRSTASRAGGKGINVARVLSALGEPTAVTGLVGGPTGVAIRGDLAASGLPDALIHMAAESRRTLTVVDSRDATAFNEPGGKVRPEEWDTFCAKFSDLVRSADVVVCSGSLPPGVPTDGYAVLVRIAAAHGVRTLLDSEGEPLRAALAARPHLVKPNAAELEATTGVSDPLAGALALRSAGAGAVVVTLGPEGLLGVTQEAVWRARPPERVAGNPTGAGDACAAALAAGLARGSPWPELLQEAVALSAAAVRARLAGEFDDSTYRRVRAGVTVEELDAADRNG
jgi:tagatose 6-phosphate kinase